MYQHIIVNTYLNKAKIRFRDAEGSYLPYESTIGEHADQQFNSFDSSLYKGPDFLVQGFFRAMENGWPEFIIAETGPHILYVTGIPLEEPTKPYRLGDENQRLFSSYWEDKFRGYLFQVVNINNTSHKEHEINIAVRKQIQVGRTKLSV